MDLGVVTNKTDHIQFVKLFFFLSLVTWNNPSKCSLHLTTFRKLCLTTPPIVFSLIFASEVTEVSVRKIQSGNL